VGWAALDLVFVVWALSGGPWYLFVPIGVLTVEVVANGVVLLRHRGPEDLALWPGRLRQASAERDTVSVPATWSPARRAGERRRQEGQLAWVAGRLTFTVAGPVGGTGDRGGRADLRGMVLLDAEPWELRLGPTPTWRRPQLVVHDATTAHLFDLSPVWDLTVGVGALVAAEWWHQLHEVGLAAPDGATDGPPAA